MSRRDSHAELLVNEGLDRRLQLEQVLWRYLVLFWAFHVAEGRVELLCGRRLGRAESALFRWFVVDVLRLRHGCTVGMCRVKNLRLRLLLRLHLFVGDEGSAGEHHWMLNRPNRGWRGWFGSKYKV